MSLRNAFWVLRQNYGEITNQFDMKKLIKSQHFVSCPWGGWGVSRQNVVDGVYNETPCGEKGRRTSNRQDRKFVEEMKIGDIVLIPFTGSKECIVARITSDVEYAIDTGLNWNEEPGQISIGENDGLPFRPVGRYIEILCDNFIPDKSLGQWTLSKMNEELKSKLIASI